MDIDRINAIIEELGLHDEYGETGGLLAFVNDEGNIEIADEAYWEIFPPDVDEATIREYLQNFVDDWQ